MFLAEKDQLTLNSAASKQTEAAQQLIGFGGAPVAADDGQVAGNRELPQLPPRRGRVQRIFKHAAHKLHRRADLLGRHTEMSRRRADHAAAVIGER